MSASVKFCGVFRSEGSNDLATAFMSKIESAGLSVAGNCNVETGAFEFWAFTDRSSIRETRIHALASDLRCLDGVVEMTMQPQR